MWVDFGKAPKLNLAFAQSVLTHLAGLQESKREHPFFFFSGSALPVAGVGRAVPGEQQGQGAGRLRVPPAEQPGSGRARPAQRRPAAPFVRLLSGRALALTQVPEKSAVSWALPLCLAPRPPRVAQLPAGAEMLARESGRAPAAATEMFRLAKGALPRDLAPPSSHSQSLPASCGDESPEGQPAAATCDRDSSI
jgi:hypothetical protein